MIFNMIKEKLREKRDGIIIICILIVYTVVNLILAGFHEAWRDESQAWVLVKGSTIPEIFSLCASEGHPVLWFLFLYPFTRLGFSFYHFSYISICLMDVAAALWLKKAPFNMFVRLCVLLSPLFFYYNPVICRVYALLMIIILLICILWKDRHDHPLYYGLLVALLLQTHMLMSGMAIGMTVDMILELKNRKGDIKKLAGLFLPIASLILLVAELKQNSSTETFLNVGPESILGNLRLRHIYDVLYSFAGKFGPVFGWVILAGSLIFLIFLFTCFIRRSEWKTLYMREFIVILCAMAVYGGVMFLVRSADHIQIAIIFWIFLMFICWELKEKDDTDGIHRIVTVFLAATCIIAMPSCLYKDLVYEINEQYSGGKEIVSLINKEVPAGSVVVLKNDLFSPSVYAYLCESPNGYYIWDVENVEEYTIHKWGKVKERDLTDAEVPKYIRDDFPDRTDCFFVSNRELTDEGLELIACNSSKSKWYEDFYIYRVF